MWFALLTSNHPDLDNATQVELSRCVLNYMYVIIVIGNRYLYTTALCEISGNIMVHYIHLSHLFGD